MPTLVRTVYVPGGDVYRDTYTDTYEFESPTPLYFWSDGIVTWTPERLDLS